MFLPAHGDPTDVERIADVRFYTAQLAKVIQPVALCIGLAVFWVKITHSTDSYYDSNVPVDVAPSASVGAAFGSQGNSSDDQKSLITALIVLAQVVVATFVIVCLFRYNQMKILFGIFMFVIFVILGYFGFLLGSNLIAILAVPFDYPTFAFCLWNLVVVGITVIFFEGPRFIQQSYLVVMSSMMAFSLTTLPDLVTWILLALLAVWDLIAVLCPYGPLRMLIESAQESGQRLPSALIYSATTTMATPGEPPSFRSTVTAPADESTNQSDSVFVAREVSPFSLQPQPARALKSAVSDSSQLGDRYAETYDDIEHRALTAATAVHNQGLGNIEMQPLGPDGLNNPTTSRDALTLQPNSSSNETSEEEDTDETGLQLGLGDFVFYSVLVGRASLFDWITTVSTMIAVTTGLSLTILLLAMYRTSLPALPISIAFGITFYLVSSVMLTPLSDSLIVRPSIQFVDPSSASALWVGKNPGGGMIYL
eukprot:jgi/Hompol1/3058/HPOL_000025-RA